MSEGIHYYRNPDHDEPKKNESSSKEQQKFAIARAKEAREQKRAEEEREAKVAAEDALYDEAVREDDEAARRAQTGEDILPPELYE